MKTAKTRRQAAARQAARRRRMASQEMAEVRGLWAPINQHPEIKDQVKRMVALKTAAQED